MTKILITYNNDTDYLNVIKHLINIEPNMMIYVFENSNTIAALVVTKLMSKIIRIPHVIEVKEEYCHADILIPIDLYLDDCMTS